MNEGAELDGIREEEVENWAGVAETIVKEGEEEDQEEREEEKTKGKRRRRGRSNKREEKG